MRLRKYKRNAIPPVEQLADAVDGAKETPREVPNKPQATKGFYPMAMFRKLIQNPNFNIQLMVILLTLTSENVSMDRRIDSMSTTVDKIRSVTEVITNTMQSVKVAAEAPKQIRRLFE